MARRSSRDRARQRSAAHPIVALRAYHCRTKQGRTPSARSSPISATSNASSRSTKHWLRSPVIATSHSSSGWSMPLPTRAPPTPRAVRRPSCCRLRSRPAGQRCVVVRTRSPADVTTLLRPPSTTRCVSLPSTCATCVRRRRSPWGRRRASSPGRRSASKRSSANIRTPWSRPSFSPRSLRCRASVLWASVSGCLFAREEARAAAARQEFGEIWPDVVRAKRRRWLSN